MSGCYPYYKCECKCHIAFNVICRCNCHFKGVRNVSPMVEQIQKLEEEINNLKSRITSLESFELIMCKAQHPRILQERIDKSEENLKLIESHINKIHDMINMEDRVTAGDVLCRLTLLENKNISDKKPHKCPICLGRGGFFINGVMDEECYACNGTAIVWG